jgi:c-di-GMP-binding flagellar brake protein YcgR
MADEIFEVGLSVSIETDYRYYFTTRLIGWERDLFLMTGIIHTGGKGEPLKINDDCKMRFLKDGIAYGFETKVISINLHPFPVMFFKFPESIEHFTIRKFDRVRSNFPAQLLDKNGNFVADATITDISAGGCGLNVHVREGRALSCANHYEIRFSILETEMQLCCSIRKMRTIRDGHILGIEFSNISQTEKERINIFLDICTNIFSSRSNLILNKLQTSGETLGGHIDELALADMLQIFDQLNKEGILNITSGQSSGFITISKGNIMDASLNNMHGEDALVELLSLKEGGFHFFTKEIKSGYIKRPINFVLVDAYRLIDERESLKEYFPRKEDKLLLLKEPDIEEPDVRTVVQAFQNGTSNVVELNAATGLSLIRSALITARLLKDGYLIHVN